MARRLLTDDSPELRASLEDLLIAKSNDNYNGGGNSLMVRNNRRDRYFRRNSLLKNDDGNRQLRWERLENLLLEGNKDTSERTDDEQVWSLLEWLIADNNENFAGNNDSNGDNNHMGNGLREPLARELVLLIDAAAAAGTRNALYSITDRINNNFGDSNNNINADALTFASQIVPELPEDELFVSRLNILVSSLQPLLPFRSQEDSDSGNNDDIQTVSANIINNINNMSLEQMSAYVDELNDTVERFAPKLKRLTSPAVRR